MQTLTGADRVALAASHIVVDFGCDILDDAGRVTGDLSPDLLGGEIQHHVDADVHRTAELHMTRKLDWPNVWLRPWQSITGDGQTATFHLGVFRPTAPETPLGALPLVYDVSCADRLSALQRSIGDTVVSVAGSAVSDQVARALVESQVPGAVLVVVPGVVDVLPSDMVWVLTPSAPTSYLQWVNDLLGAVAFMPVFMSPDGDYLASAHVPLSQRQAEWTFNLGDAPSVVRVDRTSRTDGWVTINYWRFIRNGMTWQPSEGDGLYTVDRSAGGVKTRKVVTLDATSQDALIAQGDQIVDTDSTVTQTVELTVDGFPILTHRDVVDYIDPELGGTAWHCGVSDWTLDLATGETHITLEVPRG